MFVPRQMPWPPTHLEDFQARLKAVPALAEGHGAALAQLALHASIHPGRAFAKTLRGLTADGVSLAPLAPFRLAVLPSATFDTIETCLIAAGRGMASRSTRRWRIRLLDHPDRVRSRAAEFATSPTPSSCISIIAGLPSTVQRGSRRTRRGGARPGRDGAAARARRAPARRSSSAHRHFRRRSVRQHRPLGGRNPARRSRRSTADCTIWRWRWALILDVAGSEQVGNGTGSIR